MAQSWFGCFISGLLPFLSVDSDVNDIKLTHAHMDWKTIVKYINELTNIF